MYELFLDEIGESNAQIFNIHMMMLEDEDYNGSIEGMIRSEQVNAEYAVARTSDVFAQMLEAMDNEYMRARSADVRDVSNRLLSILTDTPMDFPWVPENSVVCADDLTPSETAALERRNIAALVTAHGSAISHTAILAHSMNIPTVIGIGDEFLANIRPGEQALVDGFSGEVILEPDAGILSKLTAPQENQRIPPRERTQQTERMFRYTQRTIRALRFRNTPTGSQCSAARCSATKRSSTNTTALSQSALRTAGLSSECRL